MYIEGLDQPKISKLDSSAWLRKSSISPQDEGSLTLLQDRNLFWLNSGDCRLCPNQRRTVDHNATKCWRRAKTDYTYRHDEIVRCVAMSIAKRYGLTKSNNIRSFSPKSILRNEKATIFIDQHIQTDIIIKNNKPDLLLIDHARKFGVIIEIGVSSPRDLLLREAEKYRKYEILSDEIRAIYKLHKVEVISLVWSWDGLVTNRHRFFCRKLGLSARTTAYIQYRILKATSNICYSMANREN